MKALKGPAWTADSPGADGDPLPQRAVRTCVWLVLQRACLSASATPVAGSTGVTLSILRARDQAEGQRPGARLAVAARPLPSLPGADLAPLSAGGGGDGRALRGGCRHSGLPAHDRARARAGGGAGAGGADRPR